MKLREWMAKNDKMNNEMAKDIGIGHAYLASIVTGNRSAGYRTAWKIQNYTNNEVTLEDIISGEASSPAIRR